MNRINRLLCFKTNYLIFGGKGFVFHNEKRIEKHLKIGSLYAINTREKSGFYQTIWRVRIKLIYLFVQSWIENETAAFRQTFFQNICESVYIQHRVSIHTANGSGISFPTLSKYILSFYFVMLSLSR